MNVLQQFGGTEGKAEQKELFQAFKKFMTYKILFIKKLYKDLSFTKTIFPQNRIIDTNRLIPI